MPASAPPPSSSTTVTVAMPAATATESLDERMERIRRRNEELEQKHRIAEEDRLVALRNNAMVVTKRPTTALSETCAHRYDTYEFAYESADKTDEDQSDGSALADSSSKQACDGSAIGSNELLKTATVGPGGRDYKKFAEGEGPPPDPSFNFLADAERDGKRRAAEKASATASGKERRNQQQAGNDAGENAIQRTRGGLNGSFKSATGAQRGQNNNAGNRNNRGPQRSGANDDSNTTITSQWKNDRERIDRQKTGDGKWRREWDNEKSGGGGGDGQAGLAAQVDNLQIGGSARPIATNNNFVEKRDNVTVSVSKDGEVKSVKLQPNRSIGTGRVGNRLPTTANIIHTDSFPANDTFAPQPHPYYRQNKPQLPPYMQPTPAVFFDQPPPPPVLLPLTANLPPATRQFLDSRPTLQDRLARHRKPAEIAAAAAAVTVSSSDQH